MAEKRKCGFDGPAIGRKPLPKGTKLVPQRDGTVKAVAPKTKKKK